VGRRALGLFGALLLAVPAHAAVPVALYPPQADGLTADQVKEIVALLEVGLRGAARRDVVSLRAGPVLGHGCGAAPADRCLAGLARGGAVLVTRARRRGALADLTIALVDAQGHRSPAVTFTVNLLIQDVRPVDQAVRALEAQVASARPTPDVARAAPEPDTTAGARPQLPPDLAPPEPESTPRVVERAPVAAPDWPRGLGPWTTACGATLLAGGGVAGLLGYRLSRQLDDQYRTGALAPSDAASYRRVRAYGRATDVLLVTGGLLAATGLTLWALTPQLQPLEGGLGVGARGMF
jgi:hypothetical protein